MWLNEILKQHEEFESPLNFVWWSALAAISAVVKDNIWVDRHLFKQYPNIYVLLFADSGLKKGPPINMAKRYVQAVGNTKVISGRSSIQGILKHLGEHQTTQNGGMLKSTGFICSSELSASLVEDKAALDILTDLFDRIYNDGKYTSLLKMESFALENPTVTLLGGINPAHAESLFTKKDIQGGYIGRSFIVNESKMNAVNSLIDPPAVMPNDEENIKYLKELSQLKGPFQHLSGTPVGKFYKEWYHEIVASIQKQETKDITGTLNRISESVIKVAMLISIATKPELVITKEALEEAINRCELLIGGVRRTTLGADSKHQWAQEKALVLKELVNRDNHTISKAQLNMKYGMRANVKEWDEIISSLQVAGWITIESIGNQILYVMSEANARKWIEHFKGK